MIVEIPKISVLVITYNQEDVIGRAIDSLLSQKDYIYEICVSDDCSKDRTWDILQEYSAKYPGLFVLNRNEPNVGIFENIEKTWTMPSGEIIYQLAGDDECGDGWFKKVVDFISENNIDYKNELFCIYGDYKCIYPNGDTYIMMNKEVLTGIDPIRLTLRSLIGNRSACYSRLILNQFEKVSQGRSHIAESAQDKQLQFFSETNYYIPFVGNIYYSWIGISSQLNDDKLHDRENIETYAQEFLERKGYVFCKKDLQFLHYLKASALSYKKGIIYKFYTLWLYLASLDITFGIRGLRIKRYIFAIARRLPHNKPINWTF